MASRLGLHIAPVKNLISKHLEIILTLKCVIYLQKEGVNWIKIVKVYLNNIARYFETW